MNILDAIIGKPIKTSDERAEQIGMQEGIPIFGLDALSSAAYGPAAALSLLIPLGLLGVQYIIPISAAIITLLVIVYFSYRQTIAAYPTGGGSYTVARFNLGAFSGLLAAAALLTDYILTAAVGISAGVGALVSAVPSLQPHTVTLCVGILVVITILNLRGVREAGVAFMVPTYLFVGTLLITIVGGLVRVALSGGHPVPVTPLPPPPAMTEAVTLWILLKVFASGFTALTGVEAVSNGVKAFREPAVKNAQRTLTVIIFLLAVLLAGISYLVKVYGIAATDPGKPGYQSLLSMLIAAVFGKGVFYYLTIASILFVLSPAAALRWRHGQADPALRRGSFSGFHALAIRHGRALAEKSRRALDEERSGKWTWRICYRRHRHRGPGREICRRRLDHCHFYSLAHLLFPPRSPSLPHGQRRYELRRPGGPREGQRAAHRRRSHRALEPNLQASARICLAAFPGNHRRPRRARRSFGISPHGLGTLRGTSFPRRRRRAAQAHHFAVSVSLHHRSHCSIRSRSFREASGSANCRRHSGTGRRSLVRIFSPQPAR